MSPLLSAARRAGVSEADFRVADLQVTQADIEVELLSAGFTLHELDWELTKAQLDQFVIAIYRKKAAAFREAVTAVSIGVGTLFTKDGSKTLNESLEKNDAALRTIGIALGLQQSKAQVVDTSIGTEATWKTLPTEAPQTIRGSRVARAYHGPDGSVQDIVTPETATLIRKLDAAMSKFTGRLIKNPYGAYDGGV